MDWLLQRPGAMLGGLRRRSRQPAVASTGTGRTSSPCLNIMMIDLVLAGDNAIVVGMAASRVAPEIRAKVIFWGIAAAVVLRILFAAITVQLLPSSA